jgi:Tfp pilus assembly protein PilW
VFQSQQKAYIQVEQASSVQQNLRSALYYLESSLKMAGCDPTEGAMSTFARNNNFSGLPGNNGLVDTDADAIQLVMDIRGPAAADAYDGSIDNSIEPNENIRFVLNGTDLERNGIVIAENIDALDFVYLDQGGNVLNPGNPGPMDLMDTASITTVTYVQVTLVVRASRSENGLSGPATYENLQGTTIYTPPVGERNIRRRSITATVRLRNMGGV